jgi:hypothetical protein
MGVLGTMDEWFERVKDRVHWTVGPVLKCCDGHQVSERMPLSLLPAGGGLAQYSSTAWPSVSERADLLRLLRGRAHEWRTSTLFITDVDFMLDLPIANPNR